MYLTVLSLSPYFQFGDVVNFVFAYSVEDYETKFSYTSL